MRCETVDCIQLTYDKAGLCAYRFHKSREFFDLTSRIAIDFSRNTLRHVDSCLFTVSSYTRHFKLVFVVLGQQWNLTWYRSRTQRPGLIRDVPKELPEVQQKLLTSGIDDIVFRFRMRNVEPLRFAQTAVGSSTVRHSADAPGSRLSSSVPASAAAPPPPPPHSSCSVSYILHPLISFDTS
jgi:hypothetical protein